MEKTDKKIIKNMTEGNVPKLMLTFAMPLFLSSMLQAVYNMVDMVVIGNFVGSQGLSAAAVGGDMMNFLTFVGIGFANAGQVIISQYLGAGMKEKVSRLIGTLCTFLLSCGLCIGCVCWLLREHILRWLNTPEEAFAYTLTYVSVCIFGLVFIYGYNMASAVLRGLGDSRHPFLFILSSALVNLILDCVFVIGFQWEVFGAALATVISQFISFAMSFWFLYKKKGELGFEVSRVNFLIDREIFKQLIRLGVPMAIQTGAIQFSKIFINSWINTYGVIVSAVTGIGNKFGIISNLLGNSMNTASSTMIGQNIGAEKYGRVPGILKTAFIVNLSIAFLMSAAFICIPNQVFGLFTSEEAVLAVAMEYIPVAVINAVASGLRSPMNGLINGSGNSRLNLAVALLDGIIVRIGLSFILGIGAGMGYRGYWYGTVTASFVPFMIGSVYYLSGKWKTRRYIIQKEEKRNMAG